MAIVWAGMDTTGNAISAALYRFARHPEQWQRLRADRSRMAGAIAEVLRIESPVQRFTLLATTDVELGGTVIAEGPGWCCCSGRPTGRNGASSS